MLSINTHVKVLLFVNVQCASLTHAQGWGEYYGKILAANLCEIWPVRSKSNYLCVVFSNFPLEEQRKRFVFAFVGVDFQFLLCLLFTRKGNTKTPNQPLYLYLYLYELSSNVPYGLYSSNSVNYNPNIKTGLIHEPVQGLA